jgi:predicted aspartyl protease
MAGAAVQSSPNNGFGSMISSVRCVFGIFAVLYLLFPSASLAAGSYYIGKDSGGMYFQTDQDGGWQIPKGDQGFFKAGEQGAYSKGRDASGTYIRIDDGRKFYLDLRATENSSNSGAGPSQDQMASHSQKETKVKVIGNQVLVPVVLGYGGKEVAVSLLLDTGASITTLNRDSIKKLQAVPVHKGKMIVPGGKTIDADVIQLSYVKVGPHKMPNLYAGIIDHNGPRVDYQGLLGMNFLKEVDYKIDFKRQVIIWR